jgi:hypothetical protein
VSLSWNVRQHTSLVPECASFGIEVSPRGGVGSVEARKGSPCTRAGVGNRVVWNLERESRMRMRGEEGGECFVDSTLATRWVTMASLRWRRWTAAKGRSSEAEPRRSRPVLQRHRWWTVFGMIGWSTPCGSFTGPAVFAA